VEPRWRAWIEELPNLPRNSLASGPTISRRSGTSRRGLSLLSCCRHDCFADRSLAIREKMPVKVSAPRSLPRAANTASLTAYSMPETPLGHAFCPQQESCSCSAVQTMFIACLSCPGCCHICSEMIHQFVTVEGDAVSTTLSALKVPLVMNALGMHSLYSVRQLRVKLSSRGASPPTRFPALLPILLVDFSFETHSLYDRHTSEG
jgi:hypothetical protein